jgi:hypothetical protein
MDLPYTWLAALSRTIKSAAQRTDAAAARHRYGELARWIQLGVDLNYSFERTIADRNHIYLCEAVKDASFRIFAMHSESQLATGTGRQVKHYLGIGIGKLDRALWNISKHRSKSQPG